MRYGARVSLDVGKARVGVARSDAAGIMVFPVATVTRRADGSDRERIARIIEEFDPIEVIVGLPVTMAGEEGVSAHMARDYAYDIAIETGRVVRLVDERLSSVSAHGLLREAGRETRRHRSVVDQVAATVILEQALAIENGTGEPPGEEVLTDE